MTPLLVDAAFGREVPRTPVWLMRQAGRYMEDYRRLRQRYDFWTVCRTPELAAEVTLQPVHALQPDGAILFSDILVVLPPMGVEVAFAPGPVIDRPLRTRAEIERIAPARVTDSLSFVAQALTTLRRELPDEVALIGFCGAPLTLAAYMVEGGRPGNFETLKSLWYREPQTLHLLLDRLVAVLTDYLTMQMEAGAQVVQIFDTWAGSMPVDMITELVLPKVAALIAAVRRPEVPVIYFMKNAAHVHERLCDTGADVLSVDEKVSLDRVGAHLRPGVALQGNLDPVVLLTDPATLTAHVQQVLDSAPADRGFIFNLGHGVLPSTPLANVVHLVQEVRRLGVRPTS